MLKISYLRYTLLFIASILLQVLIFNNIVLDFFAYAVPIVYIYFILKLPFNTNRNLIVLLGFLLGIIIDIFCNTLGINAAATTFAAFLRQPILKMFIVDDEEFVDKIPGVKTFGLPIFLKYALTLLSIHIISIVLLEYFDNLYWILIIPKIICSILISILIILALDRLFGSSDSN